MAQPSAGELITHLFETALCRIEHIIGAGQCLDERDDVLVLILRLMLCQGV
jgi:hypothetical protein